MKKSLLTILSAAVLFTTSAWSESSKNEAQAPQMIPKMELKGEGNSSSFKAPKVLSGSKEIRKAKPDLYSGRVIDGAMVYNSTWDNMSFSQVPYGLYKMDMGTGAATALATDPYAYSFSAGAYSDKEFIGMRIMSMMGMFNGLNFISINTETNKENWNVMFSADEVGYGDMVSTMAYNPVDNQFYSVNYNEAMNGLNLCKFDSSAKLFKTYTTWKGNVQPLTMAFSPSGVCYVICSDGILYTLDMYTGDIKKVGETGVYPAMYNQSMAFDGVTGNFIWLAITNRGSRVYAVDPETAETEEISFLADNQQFAGAYLPLNAAYYGAPAAVASISYYASSGSLDGTLSFTLPNKTFAGAAMTGEIDYKVWIDGEPEVVRAHGTAGQGVTLPVSLTEGNHVFAVQCSNKIGESPVATATYWAGFDYPKAPESVNLTMDDSKQNFNASWSSVWEGQHKGYVNWQVTYNVYLMPGNTLVGDNVSGTSLSFPVPSDMQRYYVEVACVNSDGKEGARGKSGEILAGSAASVPFFEGFDDNTFENLWQLFDNSEAGTAKWRVQTGEIIADSFGDPIDLWAVTPPIALAASNKYQAIINMRTAWIGRVEHLKVMLGKEGMDPSEFIELADMPELEITDDFIDVPVDFSVAADGDYEIALVACSDERGSCLRISSFAVELLGKLGAPEAVTDIKIIPDADDALEATVNFNAPSLTLEEKPLSSISYINVLVDGEQALKIDNATPGNAVSALVSNINGVGKHTFSFVPFNAAGQGKIATLSQFIGCYTAPFSEKFENESALEFWTSNYNFDTSNLYQQPLHYSSYDKTLEVSWFANGEGEKAWAFTPDFKFDAESVYALSFDFQNQHYGDDSTYTVNMGMGANPDNQALLQDLPMESYYTFSPVDIEVVTSDAGKYNFGFYSYSTKAYDYPSYKIRNFALNYVTSAKAPYSITDYKGVADKTGKLEADLTFKAPAIDFANRTLTTLDKVEILRDGIVVYTFDKPAPGAELTWHDSSSNYGKNNYTIVAYNAEGRGKIYNATLFVGEDVPAVENVILEGTADNHAAILSWDRTEFGVNGGVLMDEDMVYNVFQYDPETQQMSLLDQTKDTSYTFPAVDDKAQTYYFYGVIPSNNVNNGTPAILSVLLGDLYEMPYKDSFANGVPETGLWSIYSQNPYISWQPTNYFFEGYSAQDNDGGALVFFNGNGYANYAGDRLYSPKFRLCDDGNAELSFWVLLGRTTGSEDYPYPALMRVGVSADDREFDIITKDEDMEFDGTDKNWKQFKIDLTPYKGTKHMRICFDGYTNGGYEALYLDNIKIDGEATGIDGIADNGNTPYAQGVKGLIIVRNAENAKVQIFNTSGICLGTYNGAEMMSLPYEQGIYLVKINDKVYKVQVK